MPFSRVNVHKMTQHRNNTYTMLAEVLGCSETNSEHAADTNLLDSSKALSLINRFKEYLAPMRSRDLVTNPSLLISMVVSDSRTWGSVASDLI